MREEDPTIRFCSSKWLAQTWIDILCLTGFRPVNLKIDGFSTWIVTDGKGRILRENTEVV
uniref:Uncharacterized protein n=1 Tax=viral metagenome TaxID=1070528 RepID=A0A6M3LCS2_9ZZZZ